MARQRTLSIIKPDAVEKRHTGKIIAHLLEAGFDIRAMRQMHLTTAQAEGFYAVHRERPFFGELVSFMTRSPVVVMVLEAEDAIQKYRDVIGATDPGQAAAGTIRKLYGASKGENAMHGSDGPDTASFEIGYFFAGHEVSPRASLASGMEQEGEVEGADRARGALRDAVTALQNLHALLRSPKVGPKAIASVLPEICESHATLNDASRALAEHIARRLPSREAVDDLRACVVRCAESMTAALRHAERGGVDARGRLALEARVERVAPELDAARGLFDLLLAAVDEQVVDVDLTELLEEALAPSSRRGAIWGPTAVVRAELPPHGECSGRVRPRVVIPLVHLAIAHVRGGAPVAWNHPEVHLVARASGSLTIEVRRDERSDRPARASQGDSYVVRTPVWIAPTGAVVDIVAAHTGGRVQLDASPPQARLDLPRE